MTAQRLDPVLRAYRIGDPLGAYPIYDATGSKLYPGRWNAAGIAIIYASENYSTAMLEKLAHGLGRLPPNQHWIEITIPNGVSYEVVEPSMLPGWDDPEAAAATAFGSAWALERRSAVLLVPSLVARPERNVLVNPEHPDAVQIEHSLHRRVHWDDRLFRGS